LLCSLADFFTPVLADFFLLFWRIFSSLFWRIFTLVFGGIFGRVLVYGDLGVGSEQDAPGLLDKGHDLAIV
jgi:hypothetical protein